MSKRDLVAIVRIKEKAVLQKKYDLACYLRAAQSELEKLLNK